MTLMKGGGLIKIKQILHFLLALLLSRLAFTPFPSITPHLATPNNFLQLKKN